MIKTVIRTKPIAESVVESLLSWGVAVATLTPTQGGFEVAAHDNEEVAKRLFPLRKWISV